MDDLHSNRWMKSTISYSTETESNNSITFKLICRRCKEGLHIFLYNKEKTYMKLFKFMLRILTRLHFQTYDLFNGDIILAIKDFIKFRHDINF